MSEVINTLTSIRANTPGLANEKIDNNMLLRALTLGVEDKRLYNLGKKQDVKRNAGTNKVQWRGYKPLPVANNRHVITEGVNPEGMKVGARVVDGTVAVYGAYIEVTRQTESYNLDKLLVEYLPLITDHAAETMELITRDAIEEDAGTYFVVDKGTQAPDDNKIKATNVLTLDVARLVANQMKVARRKGHESTGKNRYVVITATEGMSDLLDDEKLYQRVLIPGTTNKPVMDNGLEKYDVYNLRFIEYQYPVITENESKVAIYHTYVLGEGAYAVMNLASAGIELKRFGFEAKKGDNLGQIASLGWITMGFGAKVLDPVACTSIHHAVTNPLSRPDDIYADQD